MTSTAAPSPPPHGDDLALLETLERQSRAVDAHRLRIIGRLVARFSELVRVPDPDPDARPRFAPDEMAYRALRAELAILLEVCERTAEGLMGVAYSLVHRFAESLRHLERGRISQQHARIIVDEGAIIGVDEDDPEVGERRRGYESEALSVASETTPNRFREVARSLAERWAERPIEQRHEEARALRRVTVTEAHDGMADLHAHLPAVEAYAIKDRLTQFARSLERGERVMPSGDPADRPSPAHPTSAEPPPIPQSQSPQFPRTPRRTRDQLRADAFTDLLLGGDPYALTAGCPAEAVRARIHLIAPIDVAEPTCDGVDADPVTDREDGLLGELAGYGPISMHELRDFAAIASHHEKVAVNRTTGEVLSVKRYRPSDEIRRFIGVRDRRCRFPGCRVPGHRCDIDHTVDAAKGGSTATDNLGLLCRAHHTLKHRSDWEVQQQRAGVLVWTSPGGRKRVDRPPGMHEPPLRRARSPERQTSRTGVRFEPSPEFETPPESEPRPGF